MLSSSPIAWGIILLLVALSLLPFVLLDTPGRELTLLAPFFGLPISSILLAAWFRARVGAILAWFLVILSFFLISLHAIGPARMIQVDGNTLFSVAIGFLITALAVGQLRFVGQKLVGAHRDLTSAHATIQKQALTDGLTGLPNHRAVMDQLHNELERARHYNRPLSVLFFDADRFKHINDTHGHSTGDAVLCQIAQQATGVLRGGDTLGRFGGEEFVVLLPEADTYAARAMAERIRSAVAATAMVRAAVQEGIVMTVSIGVATYRDDAETAEALLQQADEAMYLAKRLGRNQLRTAQEAREVSADPELLLLVQEAECSEALARQGRSPQEIKESSMLSMISSLQFLVEQRDPAMYEHARRVSEVAGAIAQQLALSDHEHFLICTAALLHDIGKVGLPDTLLQKPGQLTPTERARLREHPELGAQILQVNPFLQSLIPAVRHHHECFDGTGYPDHLKGEAIPLSARIIEVAEAYDSMQRERPYQQSHTQEEAMAELRRGAGTQFDPAVVQALATTLSSPQGTTDGNGPTNQELVSYP